MSAGQAEALLINRENLYVCLSLKNSQTSCFVSFKSSILQDCHLAH